MEERNMQRKKGKLKEKKTKGRQDNSMTEKEKWKERQRIMEREEESNESVTNERKMGEEE